MADKLNNCVLVAALRDQEDSSRPRVRRITSKKDGREYRIQSFSLIRSEDERIPFDVFLEDGVAPWLPGRYLLPAAGNVEVFNDRLSFGRRLVLQKAG